MRKNHLGSEGPEISVVGFGAWEAGGRVWGPDPPEDQTIDAMTTALDNGINWIDTAEGYGGGKSEELVARAVEGRNDILIFTKLAPKNSGSGFDRDGVRRGCDASLRRLRRDRIDVYQLHWPDRSGIPVEETWEAMTGLVEEGLVRWIGVSNFSRDLIERCEKVRHVDSLQPHFSLLHQDGREDLFPFCKSNGTGIIAYGPLAYGLLTGTFDKDTTFSEDDWRSGRHGMGAYNDLFAPGVFEKNIDIVESLRPVADRLGISLPQLALAWAAHQEGVTAAIAGSRSPRHVAENAAAGSVELSEKDLEEIESIVAGGD